MTDPVPVYYDEVAWPLMEAMATCLEDQVQWVVNPPRLVGLRPGDRIELLISQYENECCDGLAWIRLASIYPSTNFPAQDETVSKCPQWAVVLEMGVARCAPVGDENHIPTMDEWREASRQEAEDAAALRRAVLCFQSLDAAEFPALAYRRLVVGEWQPMPTEGGCYGGFHTVTISAPNCDRLIEGVS